MPETIGQQLKQARQALNLTPKDVTRATHIQAHLIKAMEDDDFEAMPSPVQARAFLRIYAEFLDLSLDEVIARQRGSEGEPPSEYLPAPPAPDQAPAPEEEPVQAPASGEALDAEAGTTQQPRKEKTRARKLRVRGRPSKTTEAPALQEPDQQETPALASSPDSPREPVAPEIEGSIPDGTEEPLPARQNQPGSRSQAIFTDIGKALIQRREALSLTFDEIEQHTHVRKHYLQALEMGDFDHLPSSVQTRGMLNNYAHFLDMDVDAILLQFAEGLQAQREERQPALPEKRTGKATDTGASGIRPTGLKRYLSMDVIAGIGLVLILLAFAIWGTSRIIGLRSESTPLPSAQSISDILSTPLVTETPTSLPSSQPGLDTVVPVESPTALVTLPAVGQGPVQVVLVAQEQAFVRVTVDGKIMFNGRVAAGTAYPFDGKNQIEVLTGNGAAISILFNQSDLGVMGNIGEVVDRIYTANAILNPTATFTPTATITPIHSLTPTPTLTPTLTPTASSTP